jgi:C_GCAxxG_C_C family probable redox protein
MTPGSKEDAVNQAGEKARAYTPQHHSCSLGTLLALQEAFAIKDESAFKAAAGLHGGMGRGDVCGSLLGASLMIGLMCGKSIAESGQHKEPAGPPAGGPPPPDTATRLVGEIYDWFGKEFGSVKCEQVRSKHEKEVDAAPDAKNLSGPERMQRVHAKCDELCSKTAARTVELLWDEIKK